MSKKQKDSDILTDVVEVMGELVYQAMQLLTELVLFLLKRYVFEREWGEYREVKKIERRSLSKKTATLKDDAIGYSMNNRKLVYGHEIDKSAHTAVIGASGSGKTVLLDALMFEDMRQGKPVVYIDPKGDMGTMNKFIRMCKFTGRDFSVFSEDYYGKGSCSLNPVKDGSASNIADRIQHAFTWSEEHYAQLCRDALGEAVVNLKDDGVEITLRGIFEEISRLSRPTNKRACYQQKDVQGILSRLQKLINSPFGERLEGDNALSFKEIRESRKCVYIGLPVLGYAETARSLGRMILGDIAYCAYDIYKTLRYNSPKNPMGICIDELSAVITDEFIEILNKARGAGMELTFAIQSPSDLAKKDVHLCEQIFENSSNWFILKQRIGKSAEQLARAIGTRETKKQTRQIRDGWEQSLGSQQTVEEFLAHPNILKNLNVGQCVLLRHYPTRIDLLNIKHIDPKTLKENLKFLEGGFYDEQESNTPPGGLSGHSRRSRRVESSGHWGT